MNDDHGWAWIVARDLPENMHELPGGIVLSVHHTPFHRRPLGFDSGRGCILRDNH
jgi:hypothetical protein